MYRKIMYSVFLCTFLSINCGQSKVFPTDTTTAQPKKQTKVLWCLLRSLNCCKPKPVLVNKPQTGWGYPKRLTHRKGSLPKGWRRSSSHDED